MNFSLGHKNTIASAQHILFYSAKHAHRQLLLCVSERMRRVISRQHSRFVGPFDKCVIHRDWTQRQVQKTRADPSGNSLHTKGICCADHGTYTNSVQREFYDAYMAACSTQSNCDGGLEDHVPKRQFDLATRMMSEQASLSSTGDITNSRQYFNFPGLH